MIEATKKISPSKYKDIHFWLGMNYGLAKTCETKGCQSSGPYHWALKSGKDYAKDRTLFKQLCAGCHKQYDKSPRETRFINKRVKVVATKWATNELSLVDVCSELKVQTNVAYSVLARALKEINYATEK